MGRVRSSSNTTACCSSIRALTTSLSANAIAPVWRTVRSLTRGRRAEVIATPLALPSSSCTTPTVNSSRGLVLAAA